MSEIVEALAGVGHNAAPPIETFRLHIGDLLDAARQFLDGDPISTQAQADSVAQLLTQLRQARKGADEQRAIEKKPHDEAAKAVQAQWKPLLDQVETAEGVAKKALTPFLLAQEKARQEAAEIARKEAERLAEEARASMWAADESDLESKEETDALLKEAEKRKSEAAKLDKGKSQAATGGRSIGLRTVWHSELENSASLLVWLKANRAEELKEAMMVIVRKDVSAGSRVIPGVRIWDTKEAV